MYLVSAWHIPIGRCVPPVKIPSRINSNAAKASAFVLIRVCSSASVNGERSKFLSEGSASNFSMAARRAATISATDCLDIPGTLRSPLNRPRATIVSSKASTVHGGGKRRINPGRHGCEVVGFDLHLVAGEFLGKRLNDELGRGHVLPIRMMFDVQLDNVEHLSGLHLVWHAVQSRGNQGICHSGGIPRASSPLVDTVTGARVIAIMAVFQ